MTEKPLCENHGKFGLSYSFPDSPNEGMFATEEEALRFLADSTPEERKQIGSGMHLLQCESWFPPTDIGECVMDGMHDAYAGEVDGDGYNLFLDDGMNDDQRLQFEAEINNAIAAVTRKWVKPIETWCESRFVTWDDADEARSGK